MLENTSLTDEPPSPSSSDGHLLLLRQSLSFLPHHPRGLAAEDARLSTPYRVQLSLRTGRHWYDF